MSSNKILFITFPYSKPDDTVFTKSQYEEVLRKNINRIVCKKEYNEISYIISRNDSYRILIKGLAGSGKTTLLKCLGLYSPYNANVDLIRGFEFANSKETIKDKDVLVIDGLDEVRDQKALRLFLKNCKYPRIICTTRGNINVDDYFSRIINIKPLNKDQIYDLFSNTFNTGEQMDKALSSYLLDFSQTFTTREILRSWYQLLLNRSINNVKEFHDNHLDFLYRYKQEVDYSSGIILPDKKIITPNKEIVQGITVVNDSLLKEMKKHPEEMLKLSPRQFEEMVCELLDKQGYTVKLTKQTRDGGKDIIVVQNSLLGEFCIYVECKKYDQSNPVGVGLIRQLYGTVIADKATAGLYVTTSYYTRDAKEFTETIKHQMSLKDYNDLVHELNRVY